MCFDGYVQMHQPRGSARLFLRYCIDRGTQIDDKYIFDKGNSSSVAVKMFGITDFTKCNHTAPTGQSLH